MQPGKNSPPPGPDHDPEDWDKPEPEDHGSDPFTDRGRQARQQGSIVLACLAAGLFLSYYQVLPNITLLVDFLPVESLLLLFVPPVLGIIGIVGFTQEKAVGYHILIFVTAFFTFSRVVPVVASGGSLLGSQVFMVQGLLGAGLFGFAWYQLMLGPIRERFFSTEELQRALTIAGAGGAVLLYFMPMYA